MVRSPCVDRNGHRKGAWSQEEDDRLRAYVLKYGHWNWRLLPKYAGLQRCGKSCRLRWMNYLKPGIRRGNYSKQEEDLIVKLHDELGNKWAAIAAKLPGRTDNEIKNYWHTHLKKRSNTKPRTQIFHNHHNHEQNITSKMLSSHLKNYRETPSASNDIVTSDDALSKFSPRFKNFEASDIHIVESSSSSNSWNDPGTKNWDSQDSALSSPYLCSAAPQELQTSLSSNYDEPLAASDFFSALTQSSEFFQGDNFSRVLPGYMSSSGYPFAGFDDDSFWTEPFLLDTASYI